MRPRCLPIVIIYFLLLTNSNLCISEEITFEEVDQRIFWALTPEIMTALEERERSLRHTYTCHSPRMSGNNWFENNESFEGYGPEIGEAYTMAGLKCLKALCSGPIQRVIGNTISSLLTSPSPIIEQLYLLPNERETPESHYDKSPEEKENLRDQAIANMDCLASHQRSLRLVAHNYCFLGLSCYSLP